jgi:hypothetical protein
MISPLIATHVLSNAAAAFFETKTLMQIRLLPVMNRSLGLMCLTGAAFRAGH